MFDDLVNKKGKKSAADPQTFTAKDILKWMKEEFEEAHQKHLTKSTSTEAYCNDLESVIIRAFIRAGYTGYVDPDPKPKKK